MVEVEVADKTFPSFEIVTNQGVEEMDINVKEMLPGLFGGKKKRRKTSVAEAREILQAEEEGRLVDPGQVAREAVERAQSSGIVFLDEIDKVAGRESGRGPDVSREGVQRDLLPIVEGTVRQHEVRVRQDRPRPLHRGRRLPRLEAVGPDPGAPGPVPDPRRARLADRGGLRPHPDRAGERAAEAVPRAARRRAASSSRSPTTPSREIARDAERVNRALENIGARRLHTILERLLEDISFAGPENAGRKIRDRGRGRARRAGGSRQGRGPLALRPVKRRGSGAPASRGSRDPRPRSLPAAARSAIRRRRCRAGRGPSRTSPSSRRETTRSSRSHFPTGS